MRSESIVRASLTPGGHGTQGPVLQRRLAPALPTVVVNAPSNGKILLVGPTSLPTRHMVR